MGRRKAREIALQVLFQVDVGKVLPERALLYTLNEFLITGNTAQFARELAEGTYNNQKFIDETLKNYSVDWDLPRMANIDRNILRLALYEMFYEQDTPYSVVIDEALELAKKYSHDDSVRFINGILGQIARKHKQKEDQNDQFSD